MDINVLRGAAMTAPLTLLSVSDKDLKICDEILPYSIGFEMETPPKADVNFIDAMNEFKSIPFIMHADINSYEQRFRIPNGIKGLCCLYSICERLPVFLEFNDLSGIHYHVDTSDCFSELIKLEKHHKNHILDELEKTWNPGTYNSREVGNSHNWIRMNREFKTFEFRIGEMFFDYESIIKRIEDASRLIKWLRYEMSIPNVPIESITTTEREQILNFYSIPVNNDESRRMHQLNLKLEELRKVSLSEVITEERKKEIISKRTLKIKL